MLLKQETLRHVTDFAAYCRSSKAAQPKSLRADRAPTYRRLVWNIVEESLRRAYPICRSALTDQEWKQLVEDFMSGWNCGDPQLWKMPYQLCEFVRASGYAKELGRPYLEDLLYFEWIEIEVFMMPDVPALVDKENGDPLLDKIVLNQEHRLIELSYPVFRASAAELESQEGTYFLLAYRHPKTLKVCFIELSELWSEVLELLAKSPLSAEELLEILSEQLSNEERTAMHAALQAFLRKLQEEGMILGYR